MRILQVHDDCADPGGANSYRARLGALLGARGHQVFLFTLRGGEAERADPACWVAEPAGRTGVGGRYVVQERIHWDLLAAFRRWVATVRPDVIHLHNNFAFQNTILLGCLGGPPVVQTIHDFRFVCPIETEVRRDGRPCGRPFGYRCYAVGDLPGRRFLREGILRGGRWALWRGAVRRFIAPSRCLEGILRSMWLPSLYLPHGVPIEEPPLPPPEAGGGRILFAGYLHYSKGVDVLLRSLPAIVREVPAAQCEILGDGPVRADLERISGELGLGEAVHFRGEVPAAVVREECARSAVIVLPSTVFENCPLVVLEAMAAGRAVVASRLGGTPELVEEGETGLLVPHGDSAALAGAIVRLLRDTALARRLGEAGRQRAEKSFTEERHLEGILGLYRAVTRRRGIDAGLH